MTDAVTALPFRVRFYPFLVINDQCQVPCPARYYRNRTGAGSQNDCAYCVSGGYCPSGSTEPIDCPRGYYCVHGTLVNVSEDEAGLVEAELKQTFGVSCLSWGERPFSARNSPVSTAPTGIPSPPTPNAFASERGQACRSPSPVLLVLTGTPLAYEKYLTARSATRAAIATSVA